MLADLDLECKEEAEKSRLERQTQEEANKELNLVQTKLNLVKSEQRDDSPHRRDDQENIPPQQVPAKNHQS